jgi:hypothetical protein
MDREGGQFKNKGEILKVSQVSYITKCYIITAYRGKYYEDIKIEHGNVLGNFQKSHL